MRGPPWGSNTPADEAVIATRVATLLRALIVEAPARAVPDVAALAHAWHSTVNAGVPSVPSPAYLGQPRGSGHPDLDGYDVVLRDRVTGRITAAGTPAADVAAELDAFERAMRTAAGNLDAALPAGTPPASQDELRAVVEFAALAHGEWVRIHPYANGNGRTARLWANWVALRYGLPPFVRIKPRPDGLLCGLAAHRSMLRPPEHDLTFQVFLELLRQHPAAP